MIVTIILLSAITLLLGFRTARMFKFHKQYVKSENKRERNVALTNYVIHLVACLILAALMVDIAVNMIVNH